MTAKQTTFSAVLGVVLANLRKEREMEQADMAEKMGLSQASYSRLESGKATLSIDQMYLATSILEITRDELTKRLNSTIQQLEQNGVSVISLPRANSKQGKKESDNVVGSFLLGAALGALLVGLLSKK